MVYLVVCSVAFGASALTFLSGFGLGTLLLPAFAMFFAVEHAVALTAVVHFLNGTFKLALVWRHVDRILVVRFGLPAIAGSLAGAWTLLSLAAADPVFVYSLAGRMVAVTPAKLIVGLLLLVFACAELTPATRRIAFPRRYLPLGGLLSGYFGGLAGMQGALRSAFLIKSGLEKEAYVGTGAAIALLIDISRLGVYARLIAEHGGQFDPPLLAAAILAALAGTLLGSLYLPRIATGAVKGLVAALLLSVGAGLISGFL